MSDASLRVDAVAAPVRQKVVEVLRRAITEGRFAPGERLTERSLCELTGVSRVSVREALRQLESEGLIETAPNRGPQSMREIRAVLAAIKQRDPEAAYAASLHHVEQAAKAALANLPS